MIYNERLYITCKTFATGYKESYAITDRPMNFVVFDLETTGLNPYTNQIIEIGSAKLVDGVDCKFVYSKYRSKTS